MPAPPGELRPRIADDQIACDRVVTICAGGAQRLCASLYWDGEEPSVPVTG